MKRYNKHGAIDVLFVVALCLVVIGAGFVFWRVSETDKTIQSADIASEQTELIPAQNIDEQKITEDEFTITLSEGWERKGEITDGIYEYSKDTASMRVHTGDAILGKEYPADMTWFFTINNDGIVGNVYDRGILYCEEGSFSCTTGDDNLIINVTQVLSYSEDVRPTPRPDESALLVVLRLSDSGNIADAPVNDFKEMTKSIQLTSN